MITIGQRVSMAIEEVEKRRLEVAFGHVVVALDVTAKRYYKSDTSTKTNYKNLIKEYAWLVELMAFGGLNLEDTEFPNYPIGKNLKPTFMDLIYHVIRCNLVHDEGIPDSFKFSEHDVIEFRDGSLIFPIKLIWGLLSIVVFCPCNIDEKAGDGEWLAIFENRFVINDFWGQDQVAKIVYEKHKPIRVSLLANS